MIVNNSILLEQLCNFAYTDFHYINRTGTNHMTMDSFQNIWNIK